jgi:hypothetical protein
MAVQVLYEVGLLLVKVGLKDKDLPPENNDQGQNIRTRAFAAKQAF